MLEADQSRRERIQKLAKYLDIRMDQEVHVMDVIAMLAEKVQELEDGR